MRPPGAKPSSGVLQNLRTVGVAFLALAGLVSMGPAAALEPTDAVGVAAGAVHTCALLASGNVHCYGRNDEGQAEDYLGGDAVAVTGGSVHTCVLLSSGDVHCYGGNDFGQAEDDLGGDAVAVDAGWVHTCVLKQAGMVHCYGYNGDGQAQDYLGGDAVGVAAGTLHTCVLLSSGNVHCYGNDDTGQAADYLGGDGIAVAAGNQHTCVLRSSGNVHCYGYNGYGEANDYLGGDAVGVAAGSYFTCVLQASGNVDCYGENSSGRANDYTGGDAVAVATGQGHACILRSGGSVHCYGADDWGQASDYGSPPAPSVPGAPRDLQVTAGPGAGELTLAWQAPLASGSAAITGYRVYRSASGHNETLVASGGCASLGAVLGCTDSDLGNGTAWSYRVSALNAAGEGLASSAAGGTTLQRPTLPRSLSAIAGPAAGQITLQWDAPDSDGGAPILAYNVYAGSSSGHEVLVASVGVLAYTEEGLGAGLQRFYRVSASNLAGEGPLSVEAQATTFDAPSAPRHLQATTGLFSIHLAWRPPASDGGTPVTAYRIFFSVDGSEPKGVGTVDAGTTTFTDHHCPLLASCQYAVRAANLAGHGPRSNIVETAPLPV